MGVGQPPCADRNDTSPVTGTTTRGAGAQPAAAPVGARAGRQIEPIAVPWAAQHAVLRHDLVERPEPARANRRVNEERAILELENAERLTIQLDERQPRRSSDKSPSRNVAPDPSVRVRERPDRAKANRDCPS